MAQIAEIALDNTDMAAMTSKSRAAWKVRPEDFPRNGSKTEQIVFCIRYAILSHSTYNIQPWFFRVKGDVVEVHIDRRYALPMIDPDDREGTMACSGALFTLRLTIRYFGYRETTEISPDPNKPSLIAIVKMGEYLGDDHATDPLDVDLFEAVTKRHLNFSAFSDKPVEDNILDKLRKAAAKEGAWLHVCNEYERFAITELIAEGDHIQMSDKRFRREFASWVNPRRILSGDGMPDENLGYRKLLSSYQPLVYRRFEMSDRTVVPDEKLNDEIPVLAVLGSNGGGKEERIYAGQAFARVLLRIEAEGLSASTLNQPCEVPELRLRLHDEISHPGRAQAILRIGYGGQPIKTPRKPLSSVIDVVGKQETTKAVLQSFEANENENRGGGNIFSRFKRLFVAK